MKKLYIALSLFLASFAYSQVPQAFSYQTIAFNSAGAPIANGNVNLRISILDNSATGTVLYTETHTKTTNSKGLVNLNIGQGTATTGNFGGINWGTNSKFVKVEMDPAGGSNYTNVGVNQLMSVPYSQVSKTVVTGPGQGITLVSPNGTNYTLNVDNSGNLSLPQATTTTNTLPSNIYMYGSYNSFNPSTSELLRVTSSSKIGYKYLPANTKVKFISAQSSSSQVYGTNSDGDLVQNGDDYLINSNGFYQIYIINWSGSNNPRYITYLNNFSPRLTFQNSAPSSVSNATYNVNTNTFTINVYGVKSGYGEAFRILLDGSSSVNQENLGDNLGDSNFDFNGEYIKFPNVNNIEKNYEVNFKINFNGTGTYTITQI